MRPYQKVTLPAIVVVLTAHWARSSIVADREYEKIQLLSGEAEGTALRSPATERTGSPAYRNVANSGERAPLER